MEQALDRQEVSAKTIDDAIEIGLKQLDAEREEVEVEVLRPGRAGLFGIGAELARVRVTRLKAEGSLATQTMAVVTRLLKGMGVSATATIRSSGDEEQGPLIEIQGEDSGLLIGRRGETLQALQFLVNLILSREAQQRVSARLDVEQYRQRRVRSLEALAQRLAERVEASGRPVTLEPMSSAERRIVHMALADHPRVTTESVGLGESRKVTILPRRADP